MFSVNFSHIIMCLSVCNCNSNCNWGTCIAPPTIPRAHHRVNPYPGARRQNEAKMLHCLYCSNFRKPWPEKFTLVGGASSEDTRQHVKFLYEGHRVKVGSQEQKACLCVLFPGGPASTESDFVWSFSRVNCKLRKYAVPQKNAVSNFLE